MKEKTLGLNIMERLATSTEKVLELAEQKANEAQCKLRETKLKRVKIASIFLCPGQGIH